MSLYSSSTKTINMRKRGRDDNVPYSQYISDKPTLYKRYKPEPESKENINIKQVLNIICEKITKYETELINSNEKIKQMQNQLNHMQIMNDIYKQHLSELSHYIGFNVGIVDRDPSYIS